MQKLKVNAGKFLGANQQVRLQKAQQQNKEEAFQDGDFNKKHINISPALTRWRTVNSSDCSMHVYYQTPYFRHATRLHSKEVGSTYITKQTCFYFICTKFRYYS